MLVPADYDGDGVMDIAVWRPSTGEWLIVQSSTGAVRIVLWGVTGDIPLVGDFDGDKKADLAIFRPSSGTWFVLLSGGGMKVVNWGAPRP